MWYLVRNKDAFKMGVAIKGKEEIDALCEILSYYRSEYNIVYVGF